MKKIIYIVLPLLFLAVQGIDAQNKKLNKVKFEHIFVNKSDNIVKIDMKVNLDDLKLGTSDMLILTPMFRSNDGRNILAIEPVVVTGKQRSITLKRAIEFDEYNFSETPQGIFRRYNRKQQTIDQTINAIYEPWFEKADLIVSERLLCCGLDKAQTNEYKVLSPVFGKEEKPVLDLDYKLSFIVPPVESVKQRSETYSAQLNFKVGKKEIVRDLDNNAEILDEVEKVIKGIKENDNLSNIEFKIIGYASPEGNHLTNMQLAQDRSKAFAYYLTEKYEIPDTSIKLDWVGDDWMGLYRAVDSSDIANKAQILKALEVTDPARRKVKLKQIAGGKAYATLLKDFYPKLRRNDYTISYVAKNFDMAEAKEQFKKNPKHLSLNEMYMVANSYEKSSRNFKRVFEVAAQIYPDDPIALQNAAAILIENEEYDTAIERLETLETAEAYNNLGVAYAKIGEKEKAIEYFDKAIEAGNRSAAENKQLLTGDDFDLD